MDTQLLLKDKDFIIEKLTELLIKQSIEDKNKGTAYIKKIDVYKDLIKFIKEWS